MLDQARCEPNSDSFEAAAFARDCAFDGFVSLGGGSVMGTARAANLLASYPDELIACINAPIGKAKPIPGRLEPHIACPTTCGTGSETTASPHRRPEAGRPEHRHGLAAAQAFARHRRPDHHRDPAGRGRRRLGLRCAEPRGRVVHGAAIDEPAAAGACESQRRPYQGSTPYDDIGAIAAIRIGGRYLVRAVRDAADTDARHQLMFASTLAGLAFGSAGVHIPQATSCSIATLKHEFTASGYEERAPMVPHGIALVINAPAAFHFAAAAMGAETGGATPQETGELLAQAFTSLMPATGLPNGIAALGYGEAGVPALAEGAYAQQRPLVVAPRSVSKEDLQGLYRNALRYW